MIKGSAETLKLIFIIAFGLFIFLWVIPMMMNQLSVICKHAQMDELYKVWEELERFEKMDKIVQPTSYNLVQGFVVKTDCVSEIKYDSNKKYLFITWKDGVVQEINSTDVTWGIEGSSGDMDLKEGTWDMKVSLGKVIVKRQEQNI